MVYTSQGKAFRDQMLPDFLAHLAVWEGGTEYNRTVCGRVPWRRHPWEEMERESGRAGRVVRGWGKFDSEWKREIMFMAVSRLPTNPSLRKGWQGPWGVLDLLGCARLPCLPRTWTCLPECPCYPQTWEGSWLWEVESWDEGWSSRGPVSTSFSVTGCLQCVSSWLLLPTMGRVGKQAILSAWPLCLTASLFSSYVVLPTPTLLSLVRGEA